ncbi:MAG TPA: circadian clock protein KaiA [Elainellaceae cyanobacterium]
MSVSSYIPASCRYSVSLVILHPQLSVCALLYSDSLAIELSKAMREDWYMLNQFTSEAEFLNFVEEDNHQIDCLVLQDNTRLSSIFEQLEQRAALLPIVVLETQDHFDTSQASSPQSFTSDSAAPIVPEEQYHTAVLRMGGAQLDKIEAFIAQAITKFLELSPACSLPKDGTVPQASPQFSSLEEVLVPHQKRLAEKLRERLGYLGVYYRRNPQNFLRNMQPAEKREFFYQLKNTYREIILNYFSDDDTLNQMIDNYVNMTFFADIPIAKVVEIHMELMDDFSKQLKLEGRSEEILLDYRLTLIDTLANLCEMYRRSIPRES